MQCICVKLKLIRAYISLKKYLQIEELKCDFAAFYAVLGVGFLQFSYLNVDGCLCVQAPKRNHPVLMLSGIGTNAIGFDLDPKVRSPPFLITALGTHICIFILRGRLRVSFNMRVKCRKNRWTLCMRIWHTYGLFSNFVSLSCSVYRNWSFWGGCSML